MIIKARSALGAKTKIYTGTGLLIPNAFKFNTRTKEVSMFVMGRTSNGKNRVVTSPLKKGKVFPREAVTVTVKIRDAYAVVNGEKVK